jgi:hypothetical protein
VGYAPKGRSKEARHTDFLVERPPREVLERAETHLWLRGFSASLGERTDTAALFARTHAPRRGALKRLLNALVGAAPTPMQKIRLLASGAGEGRTRLTVLEARRGEGPGEWARVETELERWVLEELGDTGGPPNIRGTVEAAPADTTDARPLLSFFAAPGSVDRADHHHHKATIGLR